MSGRKYSLAQLTVLSWSPPKMLYNARTLGYDCVGIRPISMGVKGENDFDLAKKLFPEAALDARLLIDVEAVVHAGRAVDVEVAVIGAGAQHLDVRAVVGAVVGIHRHEDALDALARLALREFVVNIIL